jgi:hypothetical protein
MKDQDYIEDMARKYLATALWLNEDKKIQDLMDIGPDSGKFNTAQLLMIVDTVPAETIDKARLDCTRFVEENEPDIDATGMNSKDIGYLFWLNRNGHGTGFWDREPEDVNERLSKSCEKFGEMYIYRGDDNEFYLM